MYKRVLWLVAALGAVGAVAPAVGGAAAPSPYTVSCSDSGNTNVEWKHQKLTEVTITWSAPSGSDATFDPLVVPVASPTPPHGFVAVGTPSGGGGAPASVTVSFQHADGSTDQAAASCS